MLLLFYPQISEYCSHVLSFNEEERRASLVKDYADYIKSVVQDNNQYFDFYQKYDFSSTKSCFLFLSDCHQKFKTPRIEDFVDRIRGKLDRASDKVKELVQKNDDKLVLVSGLFEIIADNSIDHRLSRVIVCIIIALLPYILKKWSTKASSGTILSKNATPNIIVKDRVIFVNIKKSYDAMVCGDVTSKYYRTDLKGCTERWWAIGAQNQWRLTRATHIVGCINGYGVCVIKINGYNKRTLDNRFSFDGDLIEDSPYIGLDIRNIFPSIRNFIHPKYYGF